MQADATGLGLAIVKGLAEANGGAAWYESDEQYASCVVVWSRRPSR